MAYDIHLVDKVEYHVHLVVRQGAIQVKKVVIAATGKRLPLYGALTKSLTNKVLKKLGVCHLADEDSRPANT